MKNSDGSPVIIKSPLRRQDDEQRKAIRQLNAEMMILKNPLKNTEGIRQLIDQITISTSSDEDIRAGVFEYLDFDLHKFHLVQKFQLSRPEIKSIARQILKALSVIHSCNIVHTGWFESNR
jgi:serine/threonine protein kinase